MGSGQWAVSGGQIPLIAVTSHRIPYLSPAKAGSSKKCPCDLNPSRPSSPALLPVGQISLITHHSSLITRVHRSLRAIAKYTEASTIAVPIPAMIKTFLATEWPRLSSTFPTST